MHGRYSALIVGARMHNLARLTLAHMAEASAQLRKLATGATSMEAASERVVRFFYDQFGDDASNERGCVLVRLYATQRLRALPADLQERAGAIASASGEALTPTTRCLALLGSVGVEPAWCSRRESKGHQVIPLPNVVAVGRLPMVAQLVSQLGVDVAALTSSGSSLLVDGAERSYNVFHVAEARGSPHIPAQDFVERYAVRSVLGFGGQLPDGELFAVIMFSRVHISRDTAEAFRPLTLALKLALLPFQDGRVFESTPVHEHAR